MTTPAVQLSGLGGFDSSSVVTQLVAIAQAPVDAIGTTINNVDSAQFTLSNYSSQLSSLKSAADALATTSGFVSMSATSTDSSLVGSVTGSAAGGSYQVNVTQLAKAEKMRSTSQLSSTTPLGQAGTLSLQVGSGTAVNMDIAATDTLTDIASKIARSGARVSAGIVNAGGSYRLQLQGLDTGASNSINVTEGGSINLGLSNSASIVQPAQDANLTVDGLAVTRSSNSVADAIPGVTLALANTTTSPATVTVAGNSSSIESKLNTFVSAYNAIVSTVHSATGYGTTKASNSVLAADPSIRRTLSGMASMLSGVIPGSTGQYTSLGAVGLSLGTDGTMSLDTTKLETALASNPDSVSRLFVTDTNTGATGVMQSLSTMIGGFVGTPGTTGTIQAHEDALTAMVKSLTKSHDDKQTQVDDYQNQLKKQFAALDQAMAKYSQMGTQLGSLSTSG